MHVTVDETPNLCRQSSPRPNRRPNWPTASVLTPAALARATIRSHRILERGALGHSAELVLRILETLWKSALPAREEQPGSVRKAGKLMSWLSEQQGALAVYGLEGYNREGKQTKRARECQYLLVLWDIVGAQSLFELSKPKSRHRFTSSTTIEQDQIQAQFCESSKRQDGVRYEHRKQSWSCPD